jgi:hypothetical protein
MATTDAHATMEELLEAVVSFRFMKRLYNKEQLQLLESLETAVRIVGR